MLLRTLLVLAQADPAPAGEQRLSLTDPRVLWPTFALVVLLLIAALLLSWFDRWRRQQNTDASSPADQLNAFRLSYERGELSADEYKRIKARLATRIKQQLNVPPTPKDELDPTNGSRQARPSTDEPRDQGLNGA